MRRLEVFMVVAVLAVMAFAVSGCNETQQKPEMIQMMKPLTTTLAGFQWREAFGDDLVSVQTFNVVILTEELKLIKARIKKLEAEKDEK